MATTIILSAYVLITLLEHGLDWLNIRHLKKNGGQVPPPFQGLIDQTLLSRTSAYTVEKSRLGFWTSLTGQVAVLLFFFGPWLNQYNGWVLGLGFSYIVGALIFFMLLVYAQTILGLPFSLVQTFKLEKKYGFNTTTPGLWIMDLIKSLLLSTVLLGLLIAVSFWIIRAFPQAWWLLVWGFFLAFSLLFMVIAPYVFEPLFNKYTPLEDGPLAERIKQTAQKAGVHVSRIFKMDASKRSRHSNAYFTGIGKVKRIVLFDTLLNQMNEDEVVAVLAHELGHWKKKHVIKRLMLTETAAFIGAYAAYNLTQSPLLLSWFHISVDSMMVKLLLLLFLGGLVMAPMQPLANWLSRRHEREADAMAVDLCGEAGFLRSALIKLSKDNLSNLHPHPWYAAVHYSHPPVVARLQALENMTGC